MQIPALVLVPVCLLAWVGVYHLVRVLYFRHRLLPEVTVCNGAPHSLAYITAGERALLVNPEVNEAAGPGAGDPAPGSHGIGCFTAQKHTHHQNQTRGAPKPTRAKVALPGVSLGLSEESARREAAWRAQAGARAREDERVDRRYSARPGGWKPDVSGNDYYRVGGRKTRKRGGRWR